MLLLCFRVACENWHERYAVILRSTPWTYYMEPFRICEGVYFVGSYTGSAHLIDTGDGLILLDSSYPQYLYQIIANIQKLGFDFRNIKYILHSHGHYDHVGGTRAIVELTGAKF